LTSALLGYIPLNNVVPTWSVGFGSELLVGGWELDADLDEMVVMSSRLVNTVGTGAVVCPLSGGSRVGGVGAGVVSCRFPWPSAPAAVKDDSTNRQSSARPHEGR
jgi:hypothetical protein